MARTLSLALVTLLFTVPALADDDDVGSAQEAVCCGLECCSIGGSCFGRDQQNPADSCQACVPNESRSAFTNICTDAGPGPVDSGPMDSDAGSVPRTDSGPVITVDAGTPGTDAGSTPMDSGTTPTVDAGTGEEDGGCAVRPGASTGFGALGLIAALGLALRRRRA